MLRLAAAVLAGTVGLALPTGAIERVVPRQAAFVLLADGRLAKIGVPRGPVIVRRLATRRGTIESGPLLAVRGRTLYVLIGALVTAVDVRTLAVRRRAALPRGLRYRGLAVGPSSGRVYVAANRILRVVDPATGLAVEEAAVATVDPSRRTSVAIIRPAEGKNWSVFWIAVSPDERRLAVTYHGGCSEKGPDLCTTGADVLGIEADRLGVCTPYPPRFAGAACSPEPHGAVTPYREGWVAATGSSLIALLDPGGAYLRGLDSRVTRNHLMTYALDRAADRLYAVGSCRYLPGLNALSLATAEVQVLAPQTGSRAVCAERIAVGRGSVLALATRPAPLVGGANALVLVDGASGRRLRSLRLAAEPLEVVMGPW